MSNSLWPHGLQQARPPCPSPFPGVCSNSCPLHQWCHRTITSSVFLLLLLFLIFPGIRVFSNDSALHIMWPKYWSCSFSISPSKEHSWLIAFRTDWFDHLAIQGTLKSLLQHYSLKAWLFQCSAFFYGPTLTSLRVAGKTIVLPIWTFVSKVMSLLFNPDKGM